MLIVQTNKSFFVAQDNFITKLFLWYCIRLTFVSKKYLEVEYDVFSPGIIVIVVGIKIIVINMTPKIMKKKNP